MSHVTATAVRVLVLLLTGWLVVRLVDATSGPVIGANIGAGLAGLAAIALVAAVWGALDSRHAHAVGPVVVRWAVAAVLFGVGFTAASQLGAPVPFDWGLFLSELPMSVPFGAGLVLVPSAVGMVLGRALRPRSEVAAPTATTA